MRTVFFQASGAKFRPSSLDYRFAEALDARQVAMSGNASGRVSDRGSATIRAPAAAPDESEISGLCREVSGVLERLKVAGADRFILWIRRSGGDSCDEEISRIELQQIAALNCHLFFSAHRFDDEPTRG
jgi:hypothetical protein